MLCYGDKSFCGSSNCRNECGMKFTDEILKDAIKWWGDDNPPIAFMEFCDENGNYCE